MGVPGSTMGVGGVTTTGVLGGGDEQYPPEGGFEGVEGREGLDGCEGLEGREGVEGCEGGVPQWQGGLVCDGVGV